MRNVKLCLALAMALALCAAVAQAQPNTVRVSIGTHLNAVPGNTVEVPVNVQVQPSPNTHNLRTYMIRVSWDNDYLEFVDLLDGYYTLPEDWQRNAYTTQYGEVGVIAYQVEPTSYLTINNQSHTLFILEFMVREDAPDDMCTDLVIEEADLNEEDLPFETTSDGELCVCNRPKGYVEGYVFAYAPGTHVSPPQGCCPPVGLEDVELLLYDTYCEPCVGRLVGTAYTDGDGYFVFEDAGEYFMEPPEDPIGTTPGFPKPFRVELPYDGENNEGLIPEPGMSGLGGVINVSDLMKLEKYIVGYTALNRFWFMNTEDQDFCSPTITYPQRAAADVNQDGRINYSDLPCMVHLVEYAAGFEPEPDKQICHEPIWLAWCEYRDGQFDEWPICGPDVYLEFDFILALLGDISATLANGDVFPVKSASMLRVASMGELTNSQQFDLPVLLTGAANVDNFQFVINYDPNLVQINGIDVEADCANMTFHTRIENGRILVFAYDVSRTYSGDLTLVRLDATWLGQPSDRSELAFEGAQVNAAQPGSVLPGVVGGMVTTESSSWGQLKADYR